jgi:hypothetical protein
VTLLTCSTACNLMTAHHRAPTSKPSSELLSPCCQNRPGPALASGAAGAPLSGRYGPDAAASSSNVRKSGAALGHAAVAASSSGSPKSLSELLLLELALLLELEGAETGAASAVEACCGRSTARGCSAGCGAGAPRAGNSSAPLAAAFVAWASARARSAISACSSASLKPLFLISCFSCLITSPATRLRSALPEAFAAFACSSAAFSSVASCSLRCCGDSVLSCAARLRSALLRSICTWSG